MSKLDPFAVPFVGRPASRASYGNPMEEDGHGFHFLHTELDFSEHPEAFDALPVERLSDSDFMNKFDDDFDDSDMIYDPVQRRS